MFTPLAPSLPTRRLPPLATDVMPSVQKNNRAGRLLADLRPDDGLSIERLALLVGVKPDDLRACRDHTLTLPLLIQVRLARAVAGRIPRLTARARRLEVQATAAATMEGGTTALHLTAPVKWK